MPTFVLMKDSAQVDKIVGANPEEIRKRIDSFVQSIPANIAVSVIFMHTCVYVPVVVHCYFKCLWLARAIEIFSHFPLS
jgi:hypothetical protein